MNNGLEVIVFLTYYIWNIIFFWKTREMMEIQRKTEKWSRIKEEQSIFSLKFLFIFSLKKKNYLKKKGLLILLSLFTSRIPSLPFPLLSLVNFNTCEAWRRLWTLCNQSIACTKKEPYLNFGKIKKVSWIKLGQPVFYYHPLSARFWLKTNVEDI